LAIRAIRNSLVHQGKTPSVRNLMRALGYKSPRSAAVIIEKLVDRGVLRKKPDGSLMLKNHFTEDKTQAQTVNVPLVGSVPCGSPVLAEENIEAMVPVSVNLARPSHKHFLLRATGDSMNEAGINDGDMVLVRQQSTANNGDNVMALIDGEATIKELHKTSEIVVLKPRSKSKKHKPIILNQDFQIQGIVVATVPNF